MVSLGAYEMITIRFGAFLFNFSFFSREVEYNGLHLELEFTQD